MNKEKQQQNPEQKTELFKLQKNYCYLTGYPVDRGTIKQTPVLPTVKVNLR